MPIEWIVPTVALLLLIWAAIVQRRLVALRATAAQAWAELDALFRDRQGLVSRLIEKLEGPLGSESKTIQILSGARRTAAVAKVPEQIGKAEEALTAAIERAVGRGAGIATLRDDAGFRHLQAEFREMEEQIAALRGFFNETVGDYNSARVSFPGAFLAYVVNIPVLHALPVPKAVQAPPAGRAMQRL